MDQLGDFNKYVQFVANLSNDEKDSLGDDPTSCWLYAYYVHKIFNLPINNFDCEYPI